MRPKTWQDAQAGFAITGRVAGIVQKRPPVDDRRRLGIMHLLMADLGMCGAIDDRYAVIEARQHVQTIMRFVDNNTRWAAAADRHVLRRPRGETVVVDRTRREPVRSSTDPKAAT